MRQRRRFLGIALGTVAAASAAARATEPAVRSPSQGSRRDPIGDLVDPAQVHRVYRRMRYAGNGQSLGWWMRGRRFGIVDNVMTPFFGMEVGSLHLCRDDGDAGYRVSSVSAVYYTDLESGELLERWRNPVTGATVRFRYATPKPSVSTYRYASGPQVERRANGMLVDRRVMIGPAERIGDDIWLRDETYLTLTPDPEAKAAEEPAGGANAIPRTTRRMRVQDMYTFQAAVADLRRAPGEFVPAIAQFNDYNDWSPRFEMGDRPGTSVSRCAGRKVARIDQMPRRWLAIARRLHGDVFVDPLPLLTQALGS